MNTTASGDISDVTSDQEVSALSPGFSDNQDLEFSRSPPPKKSAIFELFGDTYVTNLFKG